jgi:hypothetical protein
MPKDSKASTSKDDFISFLASAKPEEVSQFILEKGKPHKLVEPMIFFNRGKNATKEDK